MALLAPPLDMPFDDSLENATDSKMMEDVPLKTVQPMVRGWQFSRFNLTDLFAYFDYDCPLSDSNMFAVIVRIILSYTPMDITFEVHGSYGFEKEFDSCRAINAALTERNELILSWRCSLTTKKKNSRGRGRRRKRANPRANNNTKEIRGNTREIFLVPTYPGEFKAPRRDPNAWIVRDMTNHRMVCTYDYAGRDVMILASQIALRYSRVDTREEMDVTHSTKSEGMSNILDVWKQPGRRDVFVLREFAQSRVPHLQLHVVLPTKTHHFQSKVVFRLPKSEIRPKCSWYNFDSKCLLLARNVNKSSFSRRYVDNQKWLCEILIVQSPKAAIQKHKDQTKNDIPMPDMTRKKSVRERKRRPVKKVEDSFPAPILTTTTSTQPLKFDLVDDDGKELEVFDDGKERDDEKADELQPSPSRSKSTPPPKKRKQSAQETPKPRHRRPISSGRLRDKYDRASQRSTTPRTSRTPKPRHNVTKSSPMASNLHRKGSRGRVILQENPLKMKNGVTQSQMITLEVPRRVRSLFRYCKCHLMFHHQPSQSFVLLLKHLRPQTCPLLDSTESHGRILCKITVDFDTHRMMSMSIGAVVIPEDRCRIIGFDDRRNCVILDTLTYPTRFEVKTRQRYVSSYWGGRYDTEYIVPPIYGVGFRLVRLNDLVVKWKSVFDEYSQSEEVES